MTTLATGVPSHVVLPSVKYISTRIVDIYSGVEDDDTMSLRPKPLKGAYRRVQIAAGVI